MFLDQAQDKILARQDLGLGFEFGANVAPPPPTEQIPASCFAALWPTD
jgi:hypothetical protein